jgi:hypothetical protein
MCRIAGISCSAPAGGELSRFVASVTRMPNVCSMTPVKMSVFWRNLSNTAAELRVSQRSRRDTRGRRRLWDAGKEKKRTDRNARTISSTTTVPAPTSRMLLLARRALEASSSSGHLSGKSFEISVLSVLASWTVITREGDAARSGRMLLFRAVRSAGKIGRKSGPMREGSAP